MTITAAEIVRRAQTGWPFNSVPYSQSQIWNNGPINGYRMDCSGFASMAANLSTAGGGLNTVTFLTTGTVKLISWADLAPGDFVGALGVGTAGDAGHIMVVESVNQAAGAYTVLEQAGYGAGPDRNTYRLGDGQGRNYLPYRLTTLAPPAPTTTPEEEMGAVVQNVEDNQYYVLGADGVPRQLLFQNGVTINDIGFVLSGKYRPGGATGPARPGVLCSNAVIDHEPWIDIPQIPLSVVAVKNTSGGQGPKGDPGPAGPAGPAGPKGDAAVLAPGATLIVQE